jgi:predicted metalloprotease
VRKARSGPGRLVAAVASAALALASCASVIDGHPHLGNAAAANIKVHGDSGDSFDTTVKNALSDIMDFWHVEYPKVSGGKPFRPLKGGLYSVDGLKVAQLGNPDAGKAEACIAKNPNFIIDNGAYCLLDDSIAWDRAPSHLFGQLAQHYGSLMVALIFAHEMGHAISYRLGVFNRTGLRTIDTESQADCAAGAWAAYALKGNAAHFRDITPQKVDAALEGFLDGRDATPGAPQDVSHGNGFDRLSALADGIAKGATYCFSDGYFASRVYTERPFTDPRDYAAGGNAPLADVLAPNSQNYFVKDLNRFWKSAAKSIGKTFQPVKIAEADQPPCASGTEQFGYCPDDNTVYYNRGFAQLVYDSLPGVDFDQSNGDVTLLFNQPADYALGVLFAIGWGMAVRHQLFDRSLDDHDALMAAVCYTGAYSKDVNVAAGTPGKLITLSPADLDEATSALLDQVPQSKAFGARGSTGLDRIQAFVKGYRAGLSGC